MMINIRRSRHEEGEKLIAICVAQSMPRTIFCQTLIGPNWKSW